jgi:hypothetical protein
MYYTPLIYSLDHPLLDLSDFLGLQGCPYNTTHAICGSNATLEDHMEHLIPRHWIGNDAGETTLLHTIPNSPCLHACCKKSSILHQIKTLWSNILHVCPDTIASTTANFNREPLPIPHSFVIQNSICYKW